MISVDHGNHCNLLESISAVWWCQQTHRLFEWRIGQRTFCKHIWRGRHGGKSRIEGWMQGNEQQFLALCFFISSIHYYFSFFIGYFHFKYYSLSKFPCQKFPIPSSLSLLLWGFSPTHLPCLAFPYTGALRVHRSKGLWTLIFIQILVHIIWGAT